MTWIRDVQPVKHKGGRSVIPSGRLICSRFFQSTKQPKLRKRTSDGISIEQICFFPIKRVLS
jgi:hypothetical protein